MLKQGIIIARPIYRFTTQKVLKPPLSKSMIALACLALILVPVANIFYGQVVHRSILVRGKLRDPTATSSTYAEFSDSGPGVVCSGCGDKKDIPAATSPAGSTTSAKPPKASNTSNTAAVRYPSQVLGLANWKITLPIAAPGSSIAQEIKQPLLANFELNPYFYASGNTVIFRANAGGATTSGSSYPRSELREMYGGGTHEASWSTTSGTNVMTVTEAVTHLPSVKPEVITAQVHDSSDDVLVVKLTGPHHLYVEHNSTKLGDLDTNYNLGTFFTITITASGGHILVAYNGVQKVDYPIASSGDYFKAGCYTQSNVSKGDSADAYAEVQISGIRFSHT